VQNTRVLAVYHPALILDDAFSRFNTIHTGAYR